MSKGDNLSAPRKGKLMKWLTTVRVWKSIEQSMGQCVWTYRTTSRDMETTKTFNGNQGETNMLSKMNFFGQASQTKHSREKNQWDWSWVNINYPNRNTKRETCTGEQKRTEDLKIWDHSNSQTFTEFQGENHQAENILKNNSRFFPKLMKDSKSQIQEAQRNWKRINRKKPKAYSSRLLMEKILSTTRRGKRYKGANIKNVSRYSVRQKVMEWYH